MQKIYSSKYIGLISLPKYKFFIIINVYNSIISIFDYFDYGVEYDLDIK